VSQSPPTQTFSGQPGSLGTVYVSGNAPELDVVAAALRLGAHRVVDLAPRATDLSAVTARPCVLIADRSGDAARQLLRAVSDLTDADRIHVVVVRDADAPDVDSSALPCPVFSYARPLDVAAVIAKVNGLLLSFIEDNAPPSLPPDGDQGRLSPAPSHDDTPAPLSSPTPMGRIPSPSPLLSYAPAPWGPSDGPPSSSNPPTRAWASSAPPKNVLSPDRRAFAGPTSVSPDLESLLSSAEHRVFSENLSQSDVPTPEEEVNAVLPPDVLAALDEPIDNETDDDDDDGDDPSVPRTPSGGGTTGSRRHTGTGSSVAYEAPVEPVTATGEEDDPPRALVTGAQAYSPPVTPEQAQPALDLPVGPDDAPIDPQPPTPLPLEIEARAEHWRPDLVAQEQPAAVDAKQQWAPQAAHQPHPSRVSGKSSLPPVLTPAFDGLRWLASCAALRTTGCVCFDEGGVQRRAVLRDGDFVTCASSSPDESLTAFLLERGDLPRDVVAHLSTRVPPFGRHAAAALIATGFLGQDQLWAVLRGHAEWVLTRMVRSVSGLGAIENEPPGRLKAEPSVFGGATGAEVLVEVCRRTFSVDEAVQRLGGPGSTLAPGNNGSLLAECALDDQEQTIVGQIAGATVQQAMQRAGQPEFATVLCALVALGVVEILPGLRTTGPAAALQAADVEHLDDEAIRQRVRARLAVIEEGDWFQVLGVPRNATAYEIRRAFLDARRAFEPSRLLTAATADLSDDVRLIVDVLEDAYEVLRDEARRARYLKALESSPPGGR